MAEREKNGTFKKGHSGNPAGRKPGSGVCGDLRKAIEADAANIVNSLILQAKGGDIQAAKVLLDRIMPPLKSQAMPVSIPVGQTLPETGNNVVVATMDGEVPPDVGSQLIRALADQSKLVELEEISKRLSRIEKQLENRP